MYMVQSLFPWLSKVESCLYYRSLDERKEKKADVTSYEIKIHFLIDRFTSIPGLHLLLEDRILQFFLTICAPVFVERIL